MNVEKKIYSIEEINQLKEWFGAHELPQDMQIDKATYAENLKETVKMLIEQTYICRTNPKMQGCFILLEKIKSNLEEKNTSK